MYVFFTYIIRSLKHGRYYMGSTHNVEERLKRHNEGRNKSTSNGKPWVIVRTEEYPTLKLARYREQQIKKYKGGNAFKKLISNQAKLA